MQRLNFNCCLIRPICTRSKNIFVLSQRCAAQYSTSTSKNGAVSMKSLHGHLGKEPHNRATSTRSGFFHTTALRLGVTFKVCHEEYISSWISLRKHFYLWEFSVEKIQNKMIPLWKPICFPAGCTDNNKEIWNYTNN